MSIIEVGWKSKLLTVGSLLSEDRQSVQSLLYSLYDIDPVLTTVNISSFSAA